MSNRVSLRVARACWSERWGVEPAFCRMKDNTIATFYMPTVEKALKGVPRKIDPDGAVAGVSGGTPIMNTIEEYGRLARYPTLYGQGLMLMFVIEYLQSK